MYKNFKKNFSKDKTWINEQIRIPKVQVIDENGEHVGEMDTRDALSMAREKGLDLVEIAPNAKPPVCRLTNYGKYKYEQMKKGRKQKAKSKKVDVKGVRISPRISENDLKFKAKQADKFLKEGNKVRIELMLRGRENIHKELARETFDKFIETMTEEIKIEQYAKRQRLGLAMIVTKAK